MSRIWGEVFCGIYLVFFVGIIVAAMVVGWKLGGRLRREGCSITFRIGKR